MVHTRREFKREGITEDGTVGESGNACGSGNGVWNEWE